MKLETKKELKSMSVKELQARLEELQTERIKFETQMFVKDGSSTLTRNYPAQQTESSKIGNLQRIKKDIARVKTWLNIKIKNLAKR